MRLNPRTLPSLLPNNCAHPEHTYSRNFQCLERSIKLIQPILADVGCHRLFPETRTHQCTVNCNCEFTTVATPSGRKTKTTSLKLRNISIVHVLPRTSLLWTEHDAQRTSILS